MYERHYKRRVEIPARAEELFLDLDDHERLSSHMMTSSWMMGGGRMHFSFDEAAGRKVGSVIRMTGRVLGLELCVAEVVTRRDPPWSKAWETISKPRLLVIGRYRMGFEIEPVAGQSVLTMFIDYDLPERGLPRVLGALFAPLYARWCTDRMALGAAEAVLSRPAIGAEPAR